MPKRPDWSRPLPRHLVIPEVMTLRTLADVRAFLKHVPKAHHERPQWRVVKERLTGAAAGDIPVNDLAIALQMALQIECVPCHVK